MSEKMWRVSPNRYSPGTMARRSESYWRMTTSANSFVLTGAPPPTLKTLPMARSSCMTRTFASTTSSMLT